MGRAGRDLGMQLPPHECASGEVQTSHWSDVRVPAPLRQRFDDYLTDEHDPKTAAHHLRDENCPEGRHLFDVIESVIEHEIGEPHTDDFVGYEHEFNARLTCVRCGLVLAWKGRRDGDEFAGRVNPKPLVAGELVAQETNAHRSGLGGRDMSTWTVYRDGVVVGRISWARGPRGRAYHVGRLDAWPDGETVEGTDPATTLRRISQHVKRIPTSTSGAGR